MHYRRNWKNTTVAEFKAFLAIIICLGYIQFPRREVAFDQTSGLGCRFIYKLMSEERFSHLLRAWHWENYNDYTADEIIAHKQRDAFWPITEFSELLSDAFEAMWCLTQGCDIDEGGIPWRGRHRYRCFNNMKPWPFHFKIFSLNDATNGYQKCFYLYRGKSEVRPPGVSATTYPIMKLFSLKQEHRNKGHILATDNWYSSLDVAMSVALSGNYFVGTIKTNKLGLPAEGKFPKTGNGKRLRGVLQQMTSTFQQFTFYFTAWMDKKPVHMLSTIPSAISSCIRQVKQGANALWTRMQFPIPAIIKIYNKFMGGTDGFDWRIASFRPKITTKSWVPKVLIHLLNASMVNSYLLYKWHYGKLGTVDEKRFPLSEYVELIIAELAEEFINSKIQTTAASLGSNTRTKRSWNLDAFRTSGQHFPVQTLILNSENREKSDNKYRRSDCIMCHRRVPTSCEQCGIFLCLDAPVDYENCWKQFHTKKNIMTCVRHPCL